MSRRYHIFLLVNFYSIVEPFDAGELGLIKTCMLMIISTMPGPIDLVSYDKDFFISGNPHLNLNSTTSKLVLERFDN